MADIHRAWDEPPASAPPLQLVWFDDILPCLDVMDFVQGVLVEKGAAVVYGESNAGKTFWTLDLSLHVAAGKSWFGRRVEQGAVVYCVLEGSRGFRNRVSAWRAAHAEAGKLVHFAAIESSLNLLHPEADTGRLIEAIKLAAAAVSVPVKLIVIDTLSRALMGGNENGPEDMGALVANMDRIRAATDAAVMFIHHSGKDAARGARGHTILKAAIDTEIEVVSGAESDSTKAATVVKQRELSKGDIFSFNLKPVDLGKNRHGEPVTTCTVQPVVDNLAQSTVAKKRLTKAAQIGSDMLRRAMAHHGKPFPEVGGYPPDTTAVTAEQWREAFYSGVPGENADSKRRAFNRARDELLASRVIASINDFVWFVSKAYE